MTKPSTVGRKCQFHLNATEAISNIIARDCDYIAIGSSSLFDTAGEFNESIGNRRRLVRPARHRALMLRELDSNVGSTCAHWPHEMNSPAVSRMRKSHLISAN